MNINIMNDTEFSAYATLVMGTADYLNKNSKHADSISITKNEVNNAAYEFLSAREEDQYTDALWAEYTDMTQQYWNIFVEVVRSEVKPNIQYRLGITDKHYAALIALKVNRLVSHPVWTFFNNGNRWAFGRNSAYAELRKHGFTYSNGMWVKLS